MVLTPVFSDPPTSHHALFAGCHRAIEPGGQSTEQHGYIVVINGGKITGTIKGRPQKFGSDVPFVISKARIRYPGGRHYVVFWRSSGENTKAIHFSTI